MKKTLALLAALLLAPAAAPGVEPPPLPKDLPPYAADRPLPVPSVTRERLPNGLELWLVPRAGLPKVAMTLALRGGRASDPEGLAGLSDLLSATMKEGAGKRSARQIAEELQAIGGELSVSTGSDAFYLGASSLSSGAPRLLELLASVALAPAFPAEEVELAKENAREELEVAESTPEFLASRAFASAVYGAHPYRFVAAGRETIAKATPELLRAEHARRFRPDQAILVVVGELDAASTKAAVAKAFGAWKAPAGPPPPLPPSPPARAREILLVDRPGSVQSTVVAGRPGPSLSDPDWHDVLVANTIFSEAFSSRLVTNIREQKGYTYSPSGSFTARRAGGLLEVRADVRNEVTAATLLEVFYELDRLAATSPTDAELEAALRYQAGLHLLRNQVRGAVASTLARYWVNGLPPEALAEFVPKVNAVTAERVRAAGRKHFLSSTQTVVVVGDAKEVRPQLELWGAVGAVQP